VKPPVRLRGFELQVFWTVFSGTLVFVVGQIVLNSFIEPWQRQREAVARVAYILDRYNAEILTPGVAKREAMDEAATELRRSMADLTVGPNAIPFYGALSRFLKLPSNCDLREAQKHLWGLSNSIHDQHSTNADARLSITTERLRIKLWSREDPDA
jgi:hypothetical protein